MTLIQLQRYDIHGNNAGGLYLNIDHISAVYCEETAGERQCRVVMSNGIVYHVVQSVSEVLDDISRLQGKER